MNKVRRNHDENVVYFRFFASEQYPGQFWYTNTTESSGFALGNIKDYTPIKNTWTDLKEDY